MAKENSFDVVSEVNMQEVDNAYQQTRKEMAQRYDLKGSGSKIDFDKSKGVFTLSAPSEFVANQVIDVLNSKLIKRQIDIAAIKWSEPQSASGMLSGCTARSSWASTRTPAARSTRTSRT